jgi:MFS family permease
MRGRVMAILLAVILGGTPIGAPFAGWVADTFGPRWAIAVGGIAGLAAATVGAYYLVTYQHLRLHRDRWWIRIALDDPAPNTVVETP